MWKMREKNEYMERKGGKKVSYEREKNMLQEKRKEKGW